LYTLFQRDVYAPLLAKFRHTQQTAAPSQQVGALPTVHIDAMRGFIKLAQREHSKLLVVLIPDKQDVRTDAAYSNQRMKEFLDAHNVEYVDLQPVFKSNEHMPDAPLYWATDGHWNVAGNLLAGSVVADYITSHHLFP
jgi:hypothetical protein